MFDKLNHIGIAVNRLDDKAAHFGRAFKFPGAEYKSVPSQKVKVAAYAVGGVKLEFLEADSPDSPIARFIAKKGEGIHHLGFEVADIAQTMAELKAQGVELIDAEPRVGAFGDKVAFVHPRNFGILVELVEPA